MKIRNWPCVLLALIEASSLAQADTGPLVDAPIGSITGKIRTVQGVQVDSFLGVPYAQPPINELRFSLPVPFGPVGKLNATVASARCPQPIKYSSLISEDCLYLDVHRKTGTKEGDNKPVIVILHGGIFKSGSSSDYLVHGVPLAALGNVVVVAINNRLGILGFGDMKDLAPGNLGLHDQRLAFEWIQDNIRAFGGNPDRVTLMGVNAGSMSISLHLRSPTNRHGRKLFHAAIMDGGAAAAGIVTTSDISFARMQKIAETLGCETQGQAMLECLRKADANELVKLSEDNDGYGQLFTFHPTADGKFVPQQIADNVENFFQKADIKLLVGYARDEGIFLARRIMNVRGSNIPKGTSKAELLDWCEKATFICKYPIDVKLKQTKKSILDEYYGKTNSTFSDVTAFVGDGSFICPMNNFIRSYSASNNNNVYVYRFERKLRQRYSYLDPGILGVFHSSPFIHMSGSLLGLPTTELNITIVNREDRAFFRDAIAMVSDFARTDEPPVFRGVQWPAFSDNSSVMILDERPSVSYQLYNEQRCSKVFPLVASGA